MLEPGFLELINQSEPPILKIDRIGLLLNGLAINIKKMQQILEKEKKNGHQSSGSEAQRA